MVAFSFPSTTNATGKRSNNNNNNKKKGKQVEHHRAPIDDSKHQGRNNHTHKKNAGGPTPLPSTTTTATRVCLKNIPVSFTSIQLRDFLIREYAVRQKLKSNNDDNNDDGNNSSKLIITDCRVLMHNNGSGKHGNKHHKNNGNSDKQQSRRIAFCGFQTTAMASNVIRLFDQTFALTSRLSVEPASAKAAVVSPPAVAAVVEDKAAKDKKDAKAKASSSSKDQKTSATSKALMEMTASKSKFWSNDMVIPTEEQHEEVEEDTTMDVVVDEKDESVPKKGDDDDASSDSDNDNDEDTADPLANKTIPNQQRVVSDLDFMKSKQTTVDDLPEENEDDSSSSSDDSSCDKKEANDNNAASKVDDKKEKKGDASSESNSDSDNDDSSMKDSKSKNNSDDKTPKEDDTTITEIKMNEPKDDDNKNNDDDDEEDKPIVASGRLFVRNLPFTTTEEQLEEHFAEFGNVVECHIPVDDRKMSKGYAFVTLDNRQDATLALEALDGGDFQGRFLHILHSRQKPEVKDKDNNGGMVDANGNPIKNDRPLSFKERQELTRKQDASKSSEGWSASFVRGDTVVDSLADRLGLKKGEILNIKDGLSSGDAAVRLALGETQVIEENRAYFKKHGVDMEALVSASPASQGSSDGTKRSTTSILVKNLPYDTQEEELAKIFHGAGDAPQKILLPPSRTIALVVYGHSSDAKRVFRKLAYRRFKSVPLYLEWAPMEAIDTSNPVPDEETMDRPVSSQQVLAEEADEEPALEGPTASVYIKNLNFSTTEEILKELFDKQVGDVRAVRIPTKQAPLRKPVPGAAPASNQSEEMQTLSMGFGFVEFATQEGARKALTKLQGTFLDGHALELKPSTKALTESSSRGIKPPKTKNPTKVMVRNVPFQATRTELLKLFGSFGQLKRVRLPKKFDGGHRGFAFVEFVTHKEALAGMKSLSRTHLYGRHLVLEWAEDATEDPDTGLGALREKAQRDVLHHGGGPPAKKSKHQRLS